VIWWVSANDPIADFEATGSIRLMDPTHLEVGASAQRNRLKEAAVGFAITLAPVCAMAIIQIALLEQIVGRVDEFNGIDQAWAVSKLRKEWLTIHAVAAGAVAVYWLASAGLGRGQLLRRKAANITLTLFILALFSFTVYGSIIEWPADMKSLCPLFGISDAYQYEFACDPKSSCDLFVEGFHIIMLLGLLGLMVVLLVSSAVLRIASSRRANLL
jgi:hypothetical protein